MPTFGVCLDVSSNKSFPLPPGSASTQVLEGANGHLELQCAHWMRQRWTAPRQRPSTQLEFQPKRGNWDECTFHAKGIWAGWKHCRHKLFVWYCWVACANFKMVSPQDRRKKPIHDLQSEDLDIKDLECKTKKLSSVLLTCPWRKSNVFRRTDLKGEKLIDLDADSPKAVSFQKEF